MSETSLPAAIGALAVALAAVFLLQRRFGAPPPARRFATLDGLRGYAAFLVFIGHASTWVVYARTGVATYPASRLYRHFGESSVALFFMITGLLFWSKVIDGRSRPLDWRRLYVSRVLRLFPLFVVLVALLWIVGLAADGPHLRVSPARCAADRCRLAFTIAGMPDINRTAEPR
jgi:peptidoglycan/LPS O-acetylase OafA/YrhL